MEVHYKEGGTRALDEHCRNMLIMGTMCMSRTILAIFCSFFLVLSTSGAGDVEQASRQQFANFRWIMAEECFEECQECFNFSFFDG